MGEGTGRGRGQGRAGSAIVGREDGQGRHEGTTPRHDRVPEGRFGAPRGRRRRCAGVGHDGDGVFAGACPSSASARQPGVAHLDLAQDARPDLDFGCFDLCTGDPDAQVFTGFYDDPNHDGPYCEPVIIA